MWLLDAYAQGPSKADLISMTNLCPGNAESPARGWCGDVVAGDVFTFGAKCPSLRRGQRTAIYSPPPQTTTTCPLPTLNPSTMTV